MRPGRSGNPMCNACRGAGSITWTMYDSAWPARFAHEAVRLSAALGPHAVAIEHVGSTAVPGLAGKPVLDIAVAVTSEGAADACIAPLQALGYRYRGPRGEDDRCRYLCPRPECGACDAAPPVHHALDRVGGEAPVPGRTAERSRPRRRNAREKHRVAEAVGWDKAAYAVMKGPFVERVLRDMETRRTEDEECPDDTPPMTEGCWQPPATSSGEVR